MGDGWLPEPLSAKAMPTATTPATINKSMAYKNTSVITTSSLAK